MDAQKAELFDAMLEEEIEALPAGLRRLLDRVAVVVLDEPTDQMLADLDMTVEQAGQLCGLHTGVMATERSIEDAWTIPSQIHLFRRGIIAAGGGLGDSGGVERVRKQIRITLLHEIGHEFGLDEQQLRDLGYD